MIETLPNTSLNNNIAPTEEDNLAAAHCDVIVAIEAIELIPSDQCNDFLLKSIDALCNRSVEHEL